MIEINTKILERYRGNSQLNQDVLCLSLTNFKKNGFFVEIGAADGKELSNTCLMEQKFNWRGILSEPNKCLFEKLKTNRKSFCTDLAVYHTSGLSLTFADNHHLSGLTDHFADNHERIISEVNTYQVNTITLNDLLVKYNAPLEIDYISIDTEGSEFEIIENFCFSKYKVKFFTIEHNYVESKRKKTEDLMYSNGYKKILQHLSKFDDWYIYE
jgi:FkbM family methyltransferase